MTAVRSNCQCSGVENSFSNNFSLSFYLLSFQLRCYANSWDLLLCLDPLSHPRTSGWNVHRNVRPLNIRPISSFSVFSVWLCCRRNSRSIPLSCRLLLQRMLHWRPKLLTDMLFPCCLHENYNLKKLLAVDFS